MDNSKELKLGGLGMRTLEVDFVEVERSQHNVYQV